MRRQLALYIERGVKPRRIDPATRIFLTLLSRVSPRTVNKYLPRRPRGRPRDNVRWSTFLCLHARGIIACDFFVAVTATFRLLYVFVVIERRSRRLIHFNVTAHPSSAWTLQQLREVVGTKIKYANVLKNVHSATIRQDIDLLSMARVVSKVVHTHASGLPLQADLDEKVYKLLFLDVGLMNAICGLGWKTLSKLDDLQLVNEGAIAEQFIGQHLQELLAKSPNRELTYWLREGRSSNAEVDFVVAFEGQIVPIEVKAGGRGSLRSLHQFVGERHVQLAVRFDSNPPSMQNVGATIQTDSRAVDVKYTIIRGLTSNR